MRKSRVRAINRAKSWATCKRVRVQVEAAAQKAGWTDLEERHEFLDQHLCNPDVKYDMRTPDGRSAAGVCLLGGGKVVCERAKELHATMNDIWNTEFAKRRLVYRGQAAANARREVSASSSCRKAVLRSALSPNWIMFVGAITATAAAAGDDTSEKNVDLAVTGTDPAHMSSEEVRRTARRLPPGYQFRITESDAVSPPDSPRVVIRLVADDGTPVLTGTVLSVGRHDAVQVIDYVLQQEIGDVIHADTHTMVNAAWTHYRLRVGWWHRYVTHHASTWAVVVAFLLGLVSIGLAVHQSRQSSAVVQELTAAIRGYTSNSDGQP